MREEFWTTSPGVYVVGIKHDRFRFYNQYGERRSSSSTSQQSRIGENILQYDDGGDSPADSEEESYC